MNLIFLALIFFANFAHAEAKCPPVAEKPTQEKTQAAIASARDHGFLWRISKQGHTSYLYGTIHVAKFEWMFPGAVVVQAFKASDTVALELDLMNADIQSRIVKAAAHQSNTALPQGLVLRMRQQADAICMPFESLAGRSPEFQVEALTVMVGHRDGLFAEYGIDTMLAGIAHGSGKTVVSLETPESQMKLLEMKDEQETIEFVEDSLDELETGRAHAFLTRIAKIWESSDYTNMQHFDEWCECLTSKIERDMMGRLLDERNPGLADHIDALHASGKRVFAAVGSLHMFGSTGLPTLLVKRGYRVEQVDLNPL